MTTHTTGGEGPDCPVPGCPRRRSTGHVMCKPCWRRVSDQTQRRVYKLWRRVQRDIGEWPRYKAAREQAIREAEA